MTINFIVEIPNSNVIKLTLDGQPVDKRARFDQIRYKEAGHTNFRDRTYSLPVEKSDPVRPQYYSNYPLHRISLVDCDDDVVAGPFTPGLTINYRNKKYRSDAKFSSIDDKLFIYFDEGNLYTDEDFLVPGDYVSMLGRLPNINAVVGDTVRYKIGSGFEAGVITAIAWEPTLQAEGYLLDIDATILTPVEGLAEVTYHEKPANLYSHLFDFSAVPEGTYHVLLEFGVATYTRKFYSEPIDLKTTHEDTLAIEYRHNGELDQEDLWGYIYLSDWVNVIRLPSRFYKFNPAGEVEVDINDNGIPRRLRSVPYRELELEVMNIPSWVADKLQLVFSHDSKFINGYYWENENYGNFELIDNTDVGTYRVAMRQVNDRTKFTNEFTEDITASWTPSSFTDLPFGGTLVQATFNTNTLGVFSFLEDLPDWITPNVSTFQNGTVVEFTIDENAQMFEKDETLTAVCSDFPGLEAPISFNQLYDDSAPEFLEVSSLNVLLGYAAGSNQTLNVNTSGPYTISYSGAHNFVATNPMGGIDIFHLVISEPTENDSGSNRTGVVRLTLDSNPAIFVDINVTQDYSVSTGLEGTVPTAFTFPSNGGGDSATVNVAAGVQWQASSSQSWCIVDTSIHVGSGSLSVFVNGRDLFIPAPRFAQITIVNVDNPSDTLTIIVQQN